MDPPLRKLTCLVQPDRHSAGARPRNVCSPRGGILAAEQFDDLGTSPVEKVDDQARAQSPSRMDPFDLEIIEPADEPVLAQLFWCRGAMVIVALASQQAEVAAEQVASQPKDTPAWARAQPFPIGGAQRTQEVRQTRPLDPEQRSESPWGRRRYGHAPVLPPAAVAAVPTTLPDRCEPSVVLRRSQWPRRPESCLQTRESPRPGG